MVVEDREKYLTRSGRNCTQKMVVEDREKYSQDREKYLTRSGRNCTQKIVIEDREKYLIILVGIVRKKWTWSRNHM